jgi:hypothetical protein
MAAKKRGHRKPPHCSLFAEGTKIAASSTEELKWIAAGYCRLALCPATTDAPIEQLRRNSQISPRADTAATLSIRTLSRTRLTLSLPVATVAQAMLVIFYGQTEEL